MAMLSRFIPSDWSATDAIILLAGQGAEGSYPWELVKAAQAKGATLKLLALKGETSQALKGLFGAADQREVAVGDLGGMINSVKALGGNGLIMAGQVTPGRLFKEVLPDLRAMALILSLKEKNAETIFGAISAEFEKEKVAVLDARAFMDDAMASSGVMVKGAESISQEAIAHGVKIAEAQAALDVGQSIVVRKGTVLAVEAFEGTDACIARAGGFKADTMILVKTIKAKQDWRFDVPIFGLRTLESMAAANVKNAVLKADGVIIPQREAVVKKAKELGIGIIGY